MVFSSEALASFVSGMPVARRAAVWAADAHQGQDRDVDGGPFVLHPLEVALMLHCAGYRDDVLAAAILHDVVEKTDIGLDVVVETFGPEIAAMVDVLSEDPRINDYDARKQALRDRAGASAEEVVAVFAADKVIGARELRLAAAADRLSARDAAIKRAHLVECLAVVERRLPDHPFTDALRFELAAHLAVPALAWLKDEPAGTQPGAAPPVAVP